MCHLTPGCDGKLKERWDGTLVCEECGEEDFSTTKDLDEIEKDKGNKDKKG